ncbi:MAG: GNAT family N-acetyltransferase [Tannerellaceae bacterium]|nr:GNAT family N-acetyltransferase [Tannerellaceae bacterium]
MHNPSLSFIRTNYQHRGFQQLVQQLEDELNNRYGILQQNVYNAFNQTKGIEHVVIAIVNDKMAGCGCFKIYNTYTVEIKRFFVCKDMRGSGIASRILNELEKWALEEDFKEAILETGFKQPEAIRFYSKAGYIQIPKYDPYINQANSICMGKKTMTFLPAFSFIF